MTLLRSLLALLLLAAPCAQALEDCLDCHGQHGFAAGKRLLWLQRERFAESAHFRLVCSDCHKGVASFPHPPATSTRCDLPCHVAGASHETQAREVDKSVHAGLDTPACAACHAGGPVQKGHAGALCAGCHAGIDREGAIYPDGAGAVARRAHAKAAHPPACADCHGVHAVGKGEEARKACANAGCHPGAPAAFGGLFTHAPPSAASAAPWGLPGGAAMALAALVAALLAAHCLKLPGTPREGDEKKRPVEVLDAADRGIHLLAALGLAGTLASGPALRMPGLFAPGGWVASSSPAVHAVCSGLLALALALHLTRVVLRWLAGEAPWGLVPRLADAADLARGLAWNLGLGARPRLGRHSYRERLGYAALLVATPVLFLTGLALALPGRSIGVLGPQGLSAAASLHAAFGFLALLALAWHLFFAAGQPGALCGVAPLLTGRIGWPRLRRTRPDWADELEPPALPEAPGPAEAEAARAAAVEVLLAEGNRLAREGRHAEAARRYEEALEAYPGYAQALFNLGVTRAKLGDRDGARDALTRYLAQDAFGPASGRARELLAALDAKEDADV